MNWPPITVLNVTNNAKNNDTAKKFLKIIIIIKSNVRCNNIQVSKTMRKINS